MATVSGNNQIKLNNGQVITPQSGGWYDGQQFVNGTLSNPGVINSQSNQVGAGQAVSAEVNAQSAKAQGVTPQNFNNYLQQQTQQVAKAGGATQPTAQPVNPTSTTPTAGTVMTPQSTIDLPKIYENLYSQSGIKAKQDNLSLKEQQLAEAKAKINDNPFLSEATRVGRVAKLDQLYNEQTAGLRNDIATAKADIETQMSLQTKQYDINSDAAKQSLTQFNSLLQMGALDNASGEDIANITRSTGLSSSAIYSAINNQKLQGLSTEIKTFDDGNNEGFIIYSIDKAGNVVNQTKQVTGSSSKASQYSTDATVSNFIKSLMSGNSSTGTTSTNSDISSLWTP